MSEANFNRWNFENGAPVGCVIQTKYTNTSAVFTSAVSMINDDSIPQSSEGSELLTVSITPKKVGNILKVSAHIYATNSSSVNNVIAAIFKNNLTDAVSANIFYIANAGNGGVLPLLHFETVTSTANITFKVRIGATAGTVTVNGTVGSRRFGGVASTYLMVEEIQV